MIISPVTSQTTMTLADFYTEAAANFPEGSAGVPIAGRMLELVEHLRDNVEGPQVWGLTGHLGLSLLGEDRADSPSLVLIQMRDTNDTRIPFGDPAGWSYVISYTMADEGAPWPQARVVGETFDVAEAGRRIVTALGRCARPSA
ncbi:hypothetical protein [Singulisphaera sp. PoT]|uniref:hypothetical protein n=1 Tax=Singulisphaera sp. PoT TaxID=3411797 RepID=UPI003BF4E509